MGHASPNITSQRPFSPYRLPSRHAARERLPANYSFSHCATEHPEDRLRRKTPNGTIDGGYEGSPAQLSHGPPSFKHVILQATSPSPPTRVDPSLSVGESSKLSTLNPPLLVSTQPRQVEAVNITQCWSTSQNSASLRPAFPGSYAVHERSTAKKTSGVNRINATHTSASGYPRPQDSTYTTRAVDSTTWAMEQRDFVATSSQKHALPPRWHDQPYTQPPLVFPSSPFTQSADISGSSPRSVTTPITFSGYGSSLGSHYHSPLLYHESFTIQPVIPPPEQVSPSWLRERALLQAHGAYSDLLAHLHQTRQSQQPTLGIGPSSRLLVYPKPPRHPIVAPSIPLQHASPINPSSLGSGFAAVFPSAQPSQFGSLTDVAGWDANQATNSEKGAFPYANTLPVFPHCPSPAATRNVSPLPLAKASLVLLTRLCEESEWKWIHGMMLGGCLQYSLDRCEDALEWFTRVVELDPNHVGALFNIGATFYGLNCLAEAEAYWLKAIKVQPHFLEGAEHLVGLLYKRKRREAVEVIEHVQQSLKMSELLSGHLTPQDITMNPHGFGSSGYTIAGSDNGRMLALVHAKGTILYSLHDIEGALEAFEEAILISTGRQIDSMQSLIRRIQLVLSPWHGALSNAEATQPLLLPPEKAEHTARLVFPNDAVLPGLRFVPDGPPKRIAVQTTSNCLLSLAKIFQDALSSGSANPAHQRRASGIGDILALYYLSLSLQASPSTANNVGILLASLQLSSPVPSRSNAPGMERQSRIPGIPPGSAHALALSYYNYGLLLDPKHVHIHTNLGSLLKDVGYLDLAIRMYEQAVSCDGNFDIALTNLANAIKDRGRIGDAINYYRRAVSASPDFAEAVCGLSTALNSVCDWRGRGGVVFDLEKYDRWHVDEDGNLVDAQTQPQGSGLMKRVVDIVQRQLDEAACWGSGVLREDTIPVITSYLRQASPVVEQRPVEYASKLRLWARQRWEGSRVLRLVERCTKATMRRWYCDKYLSGSERPSGYKRPTLPSSLVVPPAPTLLPFHTFTYPLTAKDTRMIAQRNADRISCSTLRSSWLPGSVYPPPSPPSPHLNVGYISSDFNNHPLAHLMQSVFGFHDTAKVKAFCYATTASDMSVHRLQIEREAPVFHDVSSWHPERTINQITKDGIHILVNLNGYTRGARNDIFAARPAPIQMSFMGFAGTLGAEWCDYILADQTAVPPGTLRPCRGNLGVEDLFDDQMEDPDWFYSENIVFCRDTFFCCDHAQSSDPEERRISWEEEQRRRWEMRKQLFPRLPDNAIILGNFNQLYKIDPSTFRTWLRILSQVPKAVLWLLRFPELGEPNLKRTARAWAGPEVANRIIFTDVAPKSQHISRTRVCDLFLDTLECNAHTTAADVLWSSTPLLTLPRYPYKMCSRMAASILRGALPKDDEGHQAVEELVASNEKEYEQMAIRLADSLTYQTSNGCARGVGRLADLRKLLWENKWTCALFDTRRWVNDLEEAYQEAWRRWVAGESGDIYL
ncbi:hypothetical protein SODALDRAFT_332286 [Sodiomyces alkalinus F11]|uniref:protein O-GlcNAc transferase n=1 Tax=Sodiomyces alkalinus (strain CBS 110278 / VKM F-3762 / F11) TaxID=1314773 RepID=A0A3N2Q0J0_SODAK|nr:hypothetical protein SODALDRAFT_332286 [Sodiomyces alkalinus F11]ROT40125.1 hypothetical protein SODALDRAFT_332286 [Sodiomyces alkalinus F11]